MKSERLTNREFDRLGKRLILAARPDESEIDKLVADPRLYGGVLAKIAAANELVPVRRRRFALKPVAVMAMSILLLSIPLLALLQYFGGTNTAVTKKPFEPSVEATEKPFMATPVQPVEEPVDKDEPIPVRTALTTRPTETRRIPRVRKPRLAKLPEPEPVFHPIGLAERAEDAAIDGRVVRVEMPRSALFALGVNLPLENGTRAVKADLLVGADGIPKGIRLVE